MSIQTGKNKVTNCNIAGCIHAILGAITNCTDLRSLVKNYDIADEIQISQKQQQKQANLTHSSRDVVNIAIINFSITCKLIKKNMVATTLVIKVTI